MKQINIKKRCAYWQKQKKEKRLLPDMRHYIKCSVQEQWKKTYTIKNKRVNLKVNNLREKQIYLKFETS